ncbi:V-type proton ATPase subunit F [Mitosporidium daphniae]|uniref:V-type proton ATPase subunit F n=1 Tax=Mitosporidium daphniae TaxID=1485682 RepID=A0A098VTH8_9MICR|nr:subunit F of V-type proton ATPase [Mitosporidium daphniae]KGG51026.1 subunit F of V-type proton ATPase [Mitosporidium daphniae]|eukprot:XP_013237477.1 subunit F of V-type proton ATPase [Mitosporidium daphniae]
MVDLKDRSLIYAIGDEVYFAMLMLRIALQAFCWQGLATEIMWILQIFLPLHPVFTIGVILETQPSVVDEVFRSFLQKKDISILLINQKIANMIRQTVDSHKEIFPVVIELPSKDHPYDPSSDSVMKRAKILSSADD